MSQNHKIQRIVLTGGPGGGKTTAADLFRREIGERIVLVPEAATLLFSGGFPRSNEAHIIQHTQKAIYHVQKNLEDIQSSQYQGRILLCDRGTVDSAVYWPRGSEDFFQQINSSLEKELSRYQAVVFFESAAVGNCSIEGGNPTRNESLAEAVELDKKLKEVWSQHPNFHFISHETSFLKKMDKAFQILKPLTS